ncbi:hypothetical protein K1719_036157 [Acacia pycnantha]|nr:hypothetical protein K1719_036157 [Acacia pycnantha]
MDEGISGIGRAHVGMGKEAITNGLKEKARRDKRHREIEKARANYDFLGVEVFMLVDRMVEVQGYEVDDEERNFVLSTREIRGIKES